ncbi:MAG: SpoIID/LytB domain-containing protein [Acidobacteriota bacterium]
MKRVWTWLAALALPWLVAGCARSVAPPLTPVETTPSSERPAEAPPAVAAPTALPLPEAAAEAPRQPVPEVVTRSPQAPIRLRVGLASDLAEVELPCCGQDLVLTFGEASLGLDEKVVVRPGPGAATTFRLQVAALRDEAQGAQLAARLERLTGEPASSHIDAATGLYQVRLGRFESRQRALAARQRWRSLDLAEAWVVAEAGDAALVLGRGDEQRRVEGRRLTVERRRDASTLAAAEDERGLVFGDRRYRGRLQVFLNERGRLNVINELPLESYLRGVVPGEMGPNLYDRIEALKAQAVAARTYTLRNLGEFEREGYDICATPRCQVYGGMSIEHPLSDQAITDTAHQVLLFDGELVDARYSSTCGGHTEDIEVVFPQENYPYLRGVPCLEAGSIALSNHLRPGARYPEAITRQFLPAPPGNSLGAFEARLLTAAQQAGLTPPTGRLASLRQGDLRRFLLALLDLVLDPRVATSLPEWVEQPPASWSTEEVRRARALYASGLWREDDERQLTPSQLEMVLYSFARTVGLLVEKKATHRALDDTGWRIRLEGREQTVELPRGLAAFRPVEDGLASDSLFLMAGDPVRMVWWRDRLVAVVQPFVSERDFRAPANRWRSWSRFRSDQRLARQVEERYPGLGFTGLEVLERGVSGRVAKLRILGRDDRSIEVEGLAIRWTLALPDTRFELRRTRSRQGAPGYFFSGSGLGHGVGMCQTGAFAMALRSHDYRQILEHYYSGVTLARARGRAVAPLRVDPAAR